VATIQIEKDKPFVRTFNLRQNDVFFVKLQPENGK